MSLDVNLSEPDEFNCKQLHTCIKHVAEVNNVPDFVYHVDYICGKGVNYVANVFRVFIKEPYSENNNLTVIVKTLVNTARQELFHELHLREVIAYETVISQFMQIQDTFDFDDMKLVLCKCLYASIEKANEVIVLKDMELDGFVSDNKLARNENLDYSQVSAVLSELAKFHALSFVFQTKDKDAYDQVKLELEDILFQDKFLNKSQLKDYFYESYEMSVSLISDFEVKKQLDTMKDSILEILQSYSKSSGKTNVFCHGDCWINNVLFRYEENKPTKVCFIDFQAMRHANPVTDIMYFIYLCTDSKFRSDHFKTLQDNYHDSLKTFLSVYDIDVNGIYPREEFENDLKEHLPFGLLTALVGLRIVSTTPEADSILEECTDELKSNQPELADKSDVMKFRVNDLINESIENNVLDQFLSLIKR